MSVFLIDYENVRTAAFNGLEDLTENDSVVIFYTSNSDNLTFSLMQRLTQCKAKIEYKKVSCGGKNALDFQLCSYLGYLIGTNKNVRFCIVSRDKGFGTMLSLWGENTQEGNSVVCCTNIFNGNGKSPVVETEAAEEAEETEKTEEEVTTEEAAIEETVEEPKPKRRRTYKRKPKSQTGEQSA